MTPTVTGLLGLLAASLVASSVASADDKTACVNAYGSAQKLRNDNQLVSAREQMRLCAQPTCPKFISRDCIAWLVDVEPRIPSIVLFAKDSGGAEISNASVSMDGVVLAQQLDGHAIEVDAGRHTFTFAFADGTKVDQSYVVLEGQKDQRVGVTVAAPAPPPPAAGPNGATPPEPLPATPASTEQPPGWSGRKTLALVVGGVGVAGLAVGAITGVMAMGSVSSQKNDCHSSAPGDCTNHAQALLDHDSASTESAVSTVGFIAGGALLAAGAVLFLTAPRNRGTEGSPAARVEVVPSAAPGWAGLSVNGRF
jgi:hypothetical protein